MNVLENVKEGDKLIVSSRWNTSIVTVEKVYKKFVIANGHKYRKDGTRISDDRWDYTYARPATEDDIAEYQRAIRCKKLISKCRQIQFENLTETQLKEILTIVNN